MPNNKEWMTVQEFAVKYSLYDETVRRLIKSGKLEGHDVRVNDFEETRSLYRISSAAEQKWLKNCKVPAPTKSKGRRKRRPKEQVEQIV